MKQIATVRRSGFALVELIALIIVIGALLALIFPALGCAREAARRMQCVNNLKVLALAVANYHDVNQCYPTEGYLGGVSNVERQFGLFPKLIPFMEQSSLFSQIDWSQSCDDGANASLGKSRIDLLLCPNTLKNDSVDPFDSGSFTTHFYGCCGAVGDNPNSGATYPSLCSNSDNGSVGANGIFQIGFHTRMSEITDGTSNTAVFFESSANNYDGYRAWQRGAFQLEPAQDECNWGDWIAHSSKTASLKYKVNAPNEATGAVFHAPINDAVVASQHAGGANVAFADGAVYFLASSVDDETFLGIFSRNGSEKIAR